MTRRHIRLIAAALLAAAPVAVFQSSQAIVPDPIHTSYIAMPHLDDEFQAWSLIQDSPSNYKIYIAMTQGEQTNFCTPSGYATGWQSGLERAASPVPQGKWTASCTNARINSWLQYMEDMSATDTSVPGDLVSLGTKGPFAANGVSQCRFDTDANNGPCTADRTARVWVDQQNRGALVVFNLGDGDLTSSEVSWAVRTVRDNRSTLGLNTTIPDYNVVGTFANTNYANCYVYQNNDHKSVHTSLYGTNFGMTYQVGATCANDPDATRFASVTAARVDDAFKVLSNGQRVGAHVNNFGWLHSSYYPIDLVAQNQLFHKNQAFWQRF